MMRKTHEKAGIGTIALAPGFHQWKSGACLDDKPLYMGTAVTFQDLKRVIPSHFEANAPRPADLRKKNRNGRLTTCRVGFYLGMLSTESVDKSGDNLRRKAQTTSKMVV